MPRIGVACVGLGRIGQVHLRNIVHMNEFKVKWLVDAKAIHSKLEQLVSRYRLGNEAKLARPEEIDKVLNDKGVKVVIVCSPMAQHEEVIKKALNAGKDVFCEKPLALTLDAVTSCYADAISLGRTLLCAYNRRFDAQYRQMYEDVQAGQYGKIRMVRMTHRDDGNNIEYLKENGGGIFMDMGIHDIDYMCWLVGEKPCTVSAFGSTSSIIADQYEKLGEVDCATAMFKFPSGAIGQLEVSRMSNYGYEEIVEVLGTLKSAKTVRPLMQRLEVTDAECVNSGKITDSFMKQFSESYEDEMLHFLRIIEGKEECLVTAESCINNMQICELLTKALKTGEVISINPKNRHN